MDGRWAEGGKRGEGGPVPAGYREWGVGRGVLEGTVSPGDSWVWHTTRVPVTSAFALASLLAPLPGTAQVRVSQARPGRPAHSARRPPLPWQLTGLAIPPCDPAGAHSHRLPKGTRWQAPHASPCTQPLSWKRLPCRRAAGVAARGCRERGPRGSAGRRRGRRGGREGLLAPGRATQTSHLIPPSQGTLGRPHGSVRRPSVHLRAGLCTTLARVWRECLWRGKLWALRSLLCLRAHLRGHACASAVPCLQEGCYASARGCFACVYAHTCVCVCR